jgi:hypothetical protein
LSYAGGKFLYCGHGKQGACRLFHPWVRQGRIKFLEGGGKTMRHIKIPDLDSVDEAKLKKMIKLVDKNAKCVEC